MLVCAGRMQIRPVVIACVKICRSFSILAVYSALKHFPGIIEQILNAVCITLYRQAVLQVLILEHLSAFKHFTIWLHCTIFRARFHLVNRLYRPKSCHAHAVALHVQTCRPADLFIVILQCVDLRLRFSAGYIVAAGFGGDCDILLGARRFLLAFSVDIAYNDSRNIVCMNSFSKVSGENPCSFT